ncbi:MAG: ABC transporter ATP-binding protein [bacterium]
MAALKIQGLKKVYKSSHLWKVKRTKALEDLNLEIADNEVFGLLGLNGSGKTTTIKLILGLLFPTEGEIFVFNQKVPDLKVASQIGYLPEVSYFFHYLTAKEILGFYAQLSDVSVDLAKKRIDEVLDLVELGENKNRRLGEFSKGMLKRVGLAQALLHNPRLLILDEPMEGLDPVGIRRMRSIILKLKDEGRTVLLSSHLISEVEKVCDRIGILSDGRIKEIVNVKTIETDLEELFMDIVQEGRAQ